MPSIACAPCGMEFDDDLFCCPHCGAAQIPQMSKAELRVRMMQASDGPTATTYLGVAVGMLLGGIYFVVTLLDGTASLGSGGVFLMGGMLGGSVGFLFHRFVLSRRR